ncbi:MAG: SUMF1/EgtB/PvdO family nonheme iron enzyme [Thermodesulfobacteriota bacterium]|nr:SUMF1/EgtB/PvdO family nonheme iron enzyme [Thermodesulfobacteriota bacterium]
MKNLIISFSLLCLIAALIFTFQTFAVTQGISVVSQSGQSFYLYKDYHSLVIGVGNYDKWPNLPNAGKDTREVSRFFKRIGFHVTLVTDPTSQELKNSFNTFVQKSCQETDRGIVIYYTGNGETQTLVDGTKLGWIIPRNCPLLRQDPQEFTRMAISTKTIEGYVSQIRSRHVIIFFDTSFSGETFSIEPPMLETIGKYSVLPVRQYIIAGGENEPVPDKSVFKRFLLKGLQGDADVIKDSYITGSELGVYLSKQVVRNTRGRQHPQYGKIGCPDAECGDFIFKVEEIIPDTGRLFVRTDPKDARVRILNIRPRFQQGIELAPGKYHVEVSKAGYITEKEWIKIELGEEKRMTVHLRKLGDTFVNSLGMKFVFIRPGDFIMGSPQEEDYALAGKKEHRVILEKGYFMQTTEVTVGQFRRFVKATGYNTEGETTGGCWVRSKTGAWKKDKASTWKNPKSWVTAQFPQTDAHPVTCVSWKDAQAFIRWLNRKEEMTYELPTEAEWEYACRAGTTTPFAFGNCLSTDQANYGGTGPYFSDCSHVYRINRKRPLPVASLASNPWGLFDMHGNVAEWCRDWLGAYPQEPVTNPKGPSSSADKVIRGGHWFTEADGCRSAKRGSFPPGSASDVIGFRLVMRPLH